MDDETVRRKIRIVSGGPAKAEAELNQLMGEYLPQVFNVQPGPDGPLVTVILLHESEVRKAQLAQARMQAPLMTGVR